MKAPYFLLESDRFPSEWGDDGDASPPPGHDFADALLQSLIAAGAESTNDTLPSDWWEHSNWYFFLTWREDKYNVTVEPAPIDTSPPRWVIGVYKPLGTLRALFGNHSRNNDLRHDVDDAFLRIVENCVMEVAQVESVERVTADEATDRLLDCKQSQRKQGGAGQPATRSESE